MIFTQNCEVQVMEPEKVTNAGINAALRSMVSQTDFSKGKAPEIFRRIGSEKRIVVMKNNKPSAIILSPDEYARLAEYAEDAELLALAEKRIVESDGTVYTQEEVLKELGISQSALDNMPEVELE